ncbi:MAG: hypothetical protein K0Q48_207 [Bacillota bacterium]|nr:hypothetical protein [Bacillota bacterium]
MFVVLSVPNPFGNELLDYNLSLRESKNHTIHQNRENPLEIIEKLRSDNWSYEALILITMKNDAICNDGVKIFNVFVCIFDFEEI